VVSEFSFVSASLTMIFGIYGVNDLLLAQDKGEFYSGDRISLLGHIDNMLRKSYSVDHGYLNPKGFLGYLKLNYSNFNLQSPADLINYILEELNFDLGKKLFIAPFGRLLHIIYTTAAQI
jgi:hypothetical protein